MRLRELNPEYRGTAWDNGTNAPATRYALTFDCPSSPGQRISMEVHAGDPVPGIWHVAEGWLGFGIDLDRLTVRPSVGDHNHKRALPRCLGHLSIVNGSVVP